MDEYNFRRNDVCPADRGSGCWQIFAEGTSYLPREQFMAEIEHRIHEIARYDSTHRKDELRIAVYSLSCRTQLKCDNNVQKGVREQTRWKYPQIF